MLVAFRVLKLFFLIFLLILSLELLCIDLSDILTFNWMHVYYELLRHNINYLS